MHKVVILGAGKIGAAIAKLLHHSGDYQVSVGDYDSNALKRLKDGVSVDTQVLDVSKPQQLDALLKGKAAVVSACSFYLNAVIAQAALKAGVSYFDLTEDVATTQTIRTVAQQAKPGQIFMPQCGLAPGFINILAYDLCKSFTQLDKVQMRVGALPRYPSNMMMYNLTWSTDGLINEYCNPCEVLYQGKPMQVLPLEGLERFSLDGMDYEAFNTSGGVGTLCETLANQAKYVDYKTIRYQGHQYLMLFLVRSLRLGERRDILKDILEKAVPITKQDVVLIFCSVKGTQEGQLTQLADARKIYHQEIYGEAWSSIQITTAGALCAVVDLHFQGKLPSSGFIKQEQVSLQEFIANRFGQYFKTSHI